MGAAKLRDRRLNERTTTLLDPGDVAATPGTEPWAIAMRLCMQSRIKDETFSRESLKSSVELFREHNGYAVLTDSRGRKFKTYEAFCTANPPHGLGHSAADIDQIIAERKSIELMAANAEPLAEHRRPTTEERGNKGSDRTFNRGETSDYLTRRIARDHPEILERMKAGEFKSVRAAGIEAGIVKVDTPYDILIRTWKKSSDEEKARFFVWVNQPGNG